MKKIILTCLLIGCSSLAWAQDMTEAPSVSLKEMAITQIFQYAESLYERGNYREASRAFAHILQLDPHYLPALDYAHKLEAAGFFVNRDFSSEHSEQVPAVEPGANADLRQQIASEKRAINDLQTQIDHMQSGGTTNE
jgi:hypothetical protein